MIRRRLRLVRLGAATRPERIGQVILVYGCIFGVVIYLLFNSTIGSAILRPIQQLQLKLAQQSFADKYGTSLVNVCLQTKSQGSAPLHSGAKLVVINVDDQTVFENCNAAMPADQQAKNKDELTHIVCLQEVRVASDLSGCANFRRNLGATVIDLKQGTIIASTKFEGYKPASCAFTTIDKDGYYAARGDLPPVFSFRNWFKQLQETVTPAN